MRSLWRVGRPLYAAVAKAPPASAASTSLLKSARGSRRFIGFTATHGEPQVGASTTPVEAAATLPQAASTSTATAEDVDTTPPVDLKDVGAETSKVLTIADVLSRREAELSQQGTAAPHFDEWESIPGTHTIQDAIDMMVEYKIGSLIVTEETAGIVGIVTERDILKKTSPRAIDADQAKAVKEIMSAQIMCIPSTTTVIDALATMTKENIRHLAVINGEINTAVMKGSVPEEAMRCVLSIKDIVKAYSVFEAQKKAAADGHTPAVDAQIDGSPPATGSTVSAPPTTGSTDDTLSTPTTPSTPVVTAATLLKKKHTKIKLILNTRIEDNVTVAEAVEEMAKHNFGAVLVVDKDQRVLGIFTERDYLTKVLYAKQDPTKLKVADLCTKKLSCLQIEDTLEKCWTQAAAMNFRHFPVIGTMRKDREKELAGILSIKDIVREISKGHETPSGFRLMEFFKSKMTKEDTPSPPPPAAPPAPTEAASHEPVKAEATEAKPVKAAASSEKP